MIRHRFSLVVVAAVVAALWSIPASSAADETGGVSATIPWHELRDLLRKAWEAEHAAPDGFTGPRYAFGPAKVDARLGAGQLRARIDIPIRTFGDGPTLVKLFDSAPAISDAVLGGKPAPLVVGGDHVAGLEWGQLGIIVSGHGEHRLVLDLVSPAPEVPGPNSTSLPALPSPAVTVNLEVSEELSDVTVGGVALTPLGEREFRVALGGGMSFVVQYVAAAPPEEHTDPEEEATPRVTATVKSLLEVGDGVLRLRSLIDFQIARAPITSVEVELPEDYELVKCEARGLRRCAIDTPGVLSAELAYEVESSLVLDVLLERGAASDGTTEEAWPALHVRNVEHEIGFLGVVAESGIEVSPGTSEGVLPLDVVELPYELQALSSRPALLAFRYTRHPFALALAITRHPSGEVLSSAVDHASITLITTEDGDRVGRAVYRVRNNRKQFLVVTLPLEARIWNAFVAGEPVKPGETDPASDGRPVYLVPLARSVGGSGGVAEAFDVEVIYFRKGAELGIAGSVTEALPSIDLPVSEMQVYLYLPYQHGYLSAGGDLDTTFGSSAELFGLPISSPFSLTFGAVDEDYRFSSVDAENEATASASTARGAYDESDGNDDDWGADTAGDMARHRGKEGRLALKAVEKFEEFGKRTAAVSGSAELTRGVLPVKFTLPEHGMMVPFTTALVLPGESPQIWVRYGPSWIGAAASVLSAGAFMAALLILAGALIRARRRRKLSGADVNLWVGIATCFVAAALVLFAGGAILPAALAGLLLAAGYSLVRWLIEREGRKDKEDDAPATTAIPATVTVAVGPAAATAATPAPETVSDDD